MSEEEICVFAEDTIRFGDSENIYYRCALGNLDVQCVKESCPIWRIMTILETKKRTNMLQEA